MSYKFSLTDNNMKKIMRYHGLWDKVDTNDWQTRFTRFGLMDPYSYVQNTREYIFITRPDLHLFEGSDLNPELFNEPYFRYALKKYPDIMKTLQISHSGMRSPFIAILTVACKSNADLPSITSESSESAANIYGTAITYARSSDGSNENHEFSLEFEDTKELEIYNIFKIWDSYRNLKDLGLVSPPKLSYILDKIIHDQVAMYKIIVTDDGESIIHFSKFTGVYPKSVPREAFSSMDKDGDLLLTVNFHAEFVDDLNPLIIEDFNHLVSSYVSGKSNVPLYDPVLEIVDRGWVDCPYIEKEHNGTHFKLVWR